MADAAVPTQELDWSRDLARQKLVAMKSGRRARAEKDYYGSAGQQQARQVGSDIVNAARDEFGEDEAPHQTISNRIEGNERLSQFRANVGDRAQRYGQLRALRAARRGEQNTQQIEATATSAFARQAYTRVWQLTEEGVQDFALSFMDLMLFSGPAAVAMFVTRLIGGNLLGGSGTISFREVTVPRIPGYSSVLEGAYKGGKVLLIGLVTGLIYSIIILLVVMISNPGLIVKIGLCSIFGNLVSFFGSTVCSG